MDAGDIEGLARALSVRTYLATTSPDLEPHVVPVHPGWEGNTIWIMTAHSSVKVRNALANPKVAMHWETNDEGDGLLVWGTAVMFSDLDTKERLWTGVFSYDLEEFAPNGLNNPDVGFLAITPHRAVHAIAYGAGGVQRWQQH